MPIPDMSRVKKARNSLPTLDKRVSATSSRDHLNYLWVIRIWVTRLASTHTSLVIGYRKKV